MLSFLSINIWKVKVIRLFLGNSVLSNQLNAVVMLWKWSNEKLKEIKYHRHFEKRRSNSCEENCVSFTESLKQGLFSVLIKRSAHNVWIQIQNELHNKNNCNTIFGRHFIFHLHLNDSENFDRAMNKQWQKCRRTTSVCFPFVNEATTPAPRVEENIASVRVCLHGSLLLTFFESVKNAFGFWH